MRYLLVAGVTALGCFAVAAGTGWASHRSQANYLLTARPGDDVRFVGLDLVCFTSPSDASQSDPSVTNDPNPAHRDPGPTMACSRWSVYKANLGRQSRWMGASNYHYWISGRTGNSEWLRVSRSP